jgi:hypothetical protein
LLPMRLIEAMCPREVCRECGEPRRRILGPWTLDAFRQSKRPQTIRAVQLADQHNLTDYHILAIRSCGIADTGKAKVTNNGWEKNFPIVRQAAEHAKKVLGGYYREFLQSTQMTRESTWTDCGHDAYRPGVVCDPFGGSGSTAVAAALCGRDCVLIDLDPRNVDLARQRLAERMRIVTETVNGDTTTWTVDPGLPGIKGEHPDQMSIFDTEGVA